MLEYGVSSAAGDETGAQRRLSARGNLNRALPVISGINKKNLSGNETINGTFKCLANQSAWHRLEARHYKGLR